MRYLQARFDDKIIRENAGSVSEGVCLGLCFSWLNWVVDAPVSDIVAAEKTRLYDLIKRKPMIIKCQSLCEDKIAACNRNELRNTGIALDISAKLFNLVVHSDYKEDLWRRYVFSLSSNSLYSELTDSLEEESRFFLVFLVGGREKKKQQWGHAIAGVRLSKRQTKSDTIWWLIFDPGIGEFLIPDDGFSNWITYYSVSKYPDITKFSTYHIERLEK